MTPDNILGDNTTLKALGLFFIAAVMSVYSWTSGETYIGYSRAKKSEEPISYWIGTGIITAMAVACGAFFLASAFGLSF